MKRSEAIQIIKDIFCEVTYDNIAEKRAEKVLMKLEEIGMLPPKHKSTTKILEEVDNGYGRFWKIERDFPTNKNEWEPEDV